MHAREARCAVSCLIYCPGKHRMHNDAFRLWLKTALLIASDVTTTEDVAWNGRGDSGDDDDDASASSGIHAAHDSQASRAARDLHSNVRAYRHEPPPSNPPHHFPKFSSFFQVSLKPTSKPGMASTISPRKPLNRCVCRFFLAFFCAQAY